MWRASEKTLEDYKDVFSIQEHEDAYVIMGYIGTKGRITVPSQIQGIPVKIADGAFKECRNLKVVTLEEGLEIIGKNTFQNCKSKVAKA